MVLAEVDDSLRSHGSAGHGGEHGHLEQVLRSALHAGETLLHVDEILLGLEVGEIGRVVMTGGGLLLESTESGSNQNQNQNQT